MPQVILMKTTFTPPPTTAAGQQESYYVQQALQNLKLNPQEAIAKAQKGDADEKDAFLFSSFAAAKLKADDLAKSSEQDFCLLILEEREITLRHPKKVVEGWEVKYYFVKALRKDLVAQGDRFRLNRDSCAVFVMDKQGLKCTLTLLNRSDIVASESKPELSHLVPPSKLGAVPDSSLTAYFKELTNFVFANAELPQPPEALELEGIELKILNQATPTPGEETLVLSSAELLDPVVVTPLPAPFKVEVDHTLVKNSKMEPKIAGLSTEEAHEEDASNPIKTNTNDLSLTSDSQPSHVESNPIKKVVPKPKSNGQQYFALAENKNRIIERIQREIDRLELTRSNVFFKKPTGKINILKQLITKLNEAKENETLESVIKNWEGKEVIKEGITEIEKGTIRIGHETKAPSNLDPKTLNPDMIVLNGERLEICEKKIEGTRKDMIDDSRFIFSLFAGPTRTRDMVEEIKNMAKNTLSAPST